jgi:hypothetical protein
MIMDASLWPRRILPDTGIKGVRHGFCVCTAFIDDFL